MAYFMSDQDSKKGKHPKIHTIVGIHNIKGKTYVNILIPNYTNKHITFNEGEHVGHLELHIEKNAADSRRSRITNNPQYHHGKDDGREG